MTTLQSSPRKSAKHQPQPLSLDAVAEMRQRFDATPQHRLMQNAVTRAPLDDVALDRRVLTAIDHTFSHQLDDWAVTAQKKSGRCWMFAGLNLLRVGAMRKMNLAAFEFSQNHTFFWDKLERANYFLEQMLLLADRDVDDRTVAYLLDHPLDDGGQWNMFVNIVRKYGLCPKAAMPETESSSNSARMNANLKAILREAAGTLRDLKAGGAAQAAIHAKKEEALDTVYRVLAIHLGTPPESFDWRWTDKDRQFHCDGRTTPKVFAERYCTLNLEDYICLVHDPRATSPVGRCFTVAHLGNVLDGSDGGGVRYVNVDIDTMKRATARTITEHQEPVWMGCDVGKMMHRELGVWDARLFDYAGVYDTTFNHTKAQRLVYHQTLMTHAMLFTGVDLDTSDTASGGGGGGTSGGGGASGGGGTRRWRVENSWGEDNGIKGFYTMNDSWFDEHMFEVAIRKDLLPPQVVAALDQDPIVLPAWDPMGSLASP